MNATYYLSQAESAERRIKQDRAAGRGADRTDVERFDRYMSLYAHAKTVEPAHA